MSNHTVRCGPVCFSRSSTSYLYICLRPPSSSIATCCHRSKNAATTASAREGDDTLIAAGNHLVASSIKPWHVGCALRRRREMVETIILETDEGVAANSVRRNLGTRPAALHPRSAPARASPGASNWTFRRLRGYVVLLETLSIEHRTHCIKHSALRK